jgi:hypothetical protein
VTRQQVTEHIAASHAPKPLEQGSFSICACEPGHCAFVVMLEEARTVDNHNEIMLRHMQDAHPDMPPFFRGTSCSSTFAPCRPLLAAPGVQLALVFSQFRRRTSPTAWSGPLSARRRRTSVWTSRP